MAASTTFAPGTSSGYSLPGGGSTPAPVVEPPAPTSEEVPSGNQPTAWTFGAFSDPDGVISSYVGTLAIIRGTPALTGGSGLGAYTVAVSDDDAYTLYLDALDILGNIVATAIRAVLVNGPAGGGWTNLSSLDYTGLDVVNPLPDAAITVTKGAVQYGPAIAVDRVSSSVAVISTGPAGVTITGITNVGSLNFGANLTAFITFAELLYLPLRIDFIFTDMTNMNGATDGVQGGMCTTGSFGTALNERSTRANYSAAGQMSTNASRQNANTNIATGVTQPTGTFTFTVVLYANAFTASWYTPGSPPSNAVIQAGGTAALPANSSPVFPSALFGVVRGIFSGGFTLTGIDLSIYR